MKRSWGACWALLGALLGAVCGGSESAVTTVRLQPLGPGDFRWADIGGRSYSASFAQSFDYAAATVDLGYETNQSGSFVTGLLQGSGLKPNFCYQLKLDGKPTALFPGDGDDLTNVRLGYAGRWWLEKYDSDGICRDAGNSTDAEYEFWLAKGFTDGTYTYVFKGYLLFDYMVTDNWGNIVQLDGSPDYAFFVDSSLHVIYNTVLNTRPPGTNDTPVTTFSVVRDNPAAYFPIRTKPVKVGLYGEWEPERALPGTLELPDGTYHARLVLTEESFHTADGNWAAALAAEVTLAFSRTAPPVVYYGGLTGTVVSESGRAVRGALVRVSGPTTAQTATNVKGNFTFSSLPEGTYQVTVEATGYAPATATGVVVRDVTSPTDPERIVLTTVAAPSRRGGIRRAAVAARH